MADNKAVKSAKPANKTVVYTKLADATNLSKKQVSEFFDELANYIKGELGNRGPGVVNIPGLMRIKKKVRPATKARKGRNPATGAEIDIPAKPKKTVVRI